MSQRSDAGIETINFKHRFSRLLHGLIGNVRTFIQAVHVMRLLGIRVKPMKLCRDGREIVRGWKKRHMNFISKGFGKALQCVELKIRTVLLELMYPSARNLQSCCDIC